MCWEQCESMLTIVLSLKKIKFILRSTFIVVWESFVSELLIYLWAVKQQQQQTNRNYQYIAHSIRTSIVSWSFCFTYMFLYVCSRLWLKKHFFHCCKLTIKWHIIGNSDKKLAIFMKNLFYLDKEISFASWPCDLQQCMAYLLN